MQPNLKQLTRVLPINLQLVHCERKQAHLSRLDNSAPTEQGTDLAKQQAAAAPSTGTSFCWVRLPPIQRHAASVALAPRFP